MIASTFELVNQDFPVQSYALTRATASEARRFLTRQRVTLNGGVY